MKNILILVTCFIFGILFLFATEACGADGEIIEVPEGHSYVAPQIVPDPTPSPPPVPPKPLFQTPLRDGMWYFGIGINRSLWYNRYWRYNRLEGLLGPDNIQQPNNPYKEK